ncbi:MAG TPA: hypothetical protein VG097_02140, partial [Gemmata sp.]|nr:hypothetical protein [Gemmata sp.]
GWDRDIRKFCAANGAVYQGFSLLTANRDVITSAAATRIAAAYSRTPAQIVFRFALDVGIIVLTGTNDAGHMRADLDVAGFSLKPEEAGQIESLLG